MSLVNGEAATPIIDTANNRPIRSNKPAQRQLVSQFARMVMEEKSTDEELQVLNDYDDNLETEADTTEGSNTDSNAHDYCVTATGCVLDDSEKASPKNVESEEEPTSFQYGEDESGVKLIEYDLAEWVVNRVNERLLADADETGISDLKQLEEILDTDRWDDAVYTSVTAVQEELGIIQSETGLDISLDDAKVIRDRVDARLAETAHLTGISNLTQLEQALLDNPNDPNVQLAVQIVEDELQLIADEGGPDLTLEDIFAINKVLVLVNHPLIFAVSGGYVDYSPDFGGSKNKHEDYIVYFLASELAMQLGIPTGEKPRTSVASNCTNAEGC